MDLHSRVGKSLWHRGTISNRSQSLMGYLLLLRTLPDRMNNMQPPWTTAEFHSEVVQTIEQTTTHLTAATGSLSKRQRTVEVKVFCRSSTALFYQISAEQPATSNFPGQPARYSLFESTDCPYNFTIAKPNPADAKRIPPVSISIESSQARSKPEATEDVESTAATP